jgi:hypothetical protein
MSDKDKLVRVDVDGNKHYVDAHGNEYYVDADGKKYNEYKMKLATGYYGLHRFKLPEKWRPWKKKLVRNVFNKVGFGSAIIRGKPGRPKK